MHEQIDTCAAFMWLDLDVRICAPSLPPTTWFSNSSNASLVITDHHACINNGAFFIRNSHRMRRFVQMWKAMNARHVYPFTDQGSMMHAMLHFFLPQVSHRCTPTGSVRFGAKKLTVGRSVPVRDFLPCLHAVLDTGLGPASAEHGSRFSPDGHLQLVYPTKGFNNHACEFDATHGDCKAHISVRTWGWHVDDLYKPGKGMFAMHTKNVSLPC